VKGDERDVDALVAQDQVDVSVDEDVVGVVAPGQEGRENGLAALERDQALARQSAEENAYFSFAHCRVWLLGVDLEQVECHTGIRPLGARLRLAGHGRRVWPPGARGCVFLAL